MFAIVGGRRFYNDSSSTTPESTITALDSLARPIWLLAGGVDKGADYRELIRTIVDRAYGAAFFGAVADSLRRQVVALDPRFFCFATAKLQDALWWCWKHSRPGHEIVLSPGCASQDQFKNFRDRGEKFVEFVKLLAREEPHPLGARILGGP